jgi:iron-sulfur cluster assembly protein
MGKDLESAGQQSRFDRCRAESRDAAHRILGALSARVLARPNTTPIQFDAARFLATRDIFDTCVILRADDADSDDRAASSSLKGALSIRNTGVANGQLANRSKWTSPARCHMRPLPQSPLDGSLHRFAVPRASQTDELACGRKNIRAATSTIGSRLLFFPEFEYNPATASQWTESSLRPLRKGDAPMSVMLTEKAAGEIKRVMTEQKLPETSVLRIAVAAGGCSGFQYSLGFDNATDSAKDQVSDQHGIKVAVDKKSSLYLDGTTLDFMDELNQRGFKFNNPNVVKSCGCGSSFSA